MKNWITATAFFYQISAANLQALQSVLNSAARLIMRKRKYDRITATLRDDLHWQRIMYKLCVPSSTSVYCVHGAAPSYLTEMCIPVSASTGRRLLLRSASHGDLMVPWARTSTYGQRSFAVSGPSVWNDLTPTLRASSTTLGTDPE